MIHANEGGGDSGAFSSMGRSISLFPFSLRNNQGISQSLIKKPLCHTKFASNVYPSIGWVVVKEDRVCWALIGT
jgi:hypothetical protein